MRIAFSAIVLFTSVLVACGGGEKPGGQPSTPGGAPPAGGGATAAATAQAQPVTGKTWDVKMFGDASGYRFDPVSVTIKRGDGVRWTVVSGPPHNVTFWSDSIPPAAVAGLQANMPQTTASLTGPLLMNPSQTYLVSFGGLAAGAYRYYCTPHLALGMKGTVIVQ